MGGIGSHGTLPCCLAVCLSHLYIREPEIYSKYTLDSGMALSRIGLWSFDLVQLTQLQKSLAHHPRQNTLTALQFSLQNVFDLAHYGLTLGWNKPEQFKYAAVVCVSFTHWCRAN